MKLLVPVVASMFAGDNIDGWTEITKTKLGLLADGL